MPNQKNQTQVKKLESKLETVSAIFLADYQGMNTKDQRNLRTAVREAGGELLVTKNTLLKIALKNKGYDADAISEFLKGANITLFASTDPVTPLKALVKFAKSLDKELPMVKTGFLGKEMLTVDKIKQLAALPSKTELIAKLLGTLNNPARNMVSILFAPMRSLVYALSAIQTKKAVQ